MLIITIATIKANFNLTTIKANQQGRKNIGTTAPVEGLMIVRRFRKTAIHLSKPWNHRLHHQHWTIMML